MEATLNRSRLLSAGVLLTVLLMLAGLPVAVYLDLRDMTEVTLRRQARDLDDALTSIRNYYASDVVGRVLDNPGSTQVLHTYQSTPGAIPLPATLSLELGRLIQANGRSDIGYRFVSDYPFANRAPHPLDEFERDALLRLRQDPTAGPIFNSTYTGFTGRVRMITPVIMGGACVSCHNSHPESPKHDWKVGDVRAIQEITVALPLATNLFSFRYLLIYFSVGAAAGIAFILLQRHQTAAIRKVNGDLESANNFLADVSLKISRYLSPHVYRSIFSGELDTTIHTKRKKLTIFFSDIKDFTSTTERLQPEDLTALLNEYLDEMSHIALAHGGTVDKFFGDAMLIFFGDPETKGEAEDARACLRMAVAMRQRLAELTVLWLDRGILRPFQVRMGINTGYCNVGNFGSSDRMDYTIIGAEANLAARLQSIAEPGSIAMSAETFALVKDIAIAHPLPPITMKGFAEPLVPYVLDRMADAMPAAELHEHEDGLDLHLDLAKIDAANAGRVRAALQRAVVALAARPAKEA